MFTKTLKRLKSFRPLRRLVIISAIIAMYFIFISLVSEIVDQRAIEQEVKDWFEGSLNYATYVDIDHTDTALRSDWRTDLYIHEFEIASPNPSYVLPLISVDTIRASSNFYSLFGGVSAEPIVQIRDGLLNIEQMSDGTYNFASINPTTNLPNPNFVPNIDIASIDFILMNCIVKAKVSGISATIPISGRLQLKNDNIILKSSSKNCKFNTSHNGVEKNYKSNIYVRNLIVNKASKEIISCDIALEDVPATTLNMIIPILPKLPTGLNLTGNITTIGNAIVFNGQAENLTIPSMPGFFEIRVSTNRSFLTKPEYYFVELSYNHTQLLTIKAQSSPEGKWEPLKLYFSKINIDDLLAGSDSDWLNYFINNFPAMHAVASSALLANFDIGEAVFNVIKSSTGTTDISLDGNIASGKLTLLARDISLTNSRLPKTVMATLEIKDAADTLLKFSKNLPHVLDCTPKRGSGEIALLYQRSDNDSTEDAIKVQLHLEDVVLPTLSSGEAVSALSQLPINLNRLNKLCRKPDISLTEASTDLIDSFSEITFDTLSVTYETSTDDKIRLSSIDAESKELGNLQGKLYKIGEDSLQLQLNISNIPQETFERARLSNESLKAVSNFKENNSLKINLIENHHKITIENLYIENIYSDWLNEQTLAGIHLKKQE